MNDPSHAAFVTYAWLIGSGIGLVPIIITIGYLFSKGKVNKEVCKVLHETADKVIGLIHVTLTSQQQLIQETHDAVIRIEAIQNGAKK